MDPKLDRGAADDALPQDLSQEEREQLHEREPGALERFYDLYFDRVYAYVRRLLREEHLAEDMTQEIFMHIHRSLPTYDPSRELRPWVFTIATNKVRDHWRSRRHRDVQREVGVEDEEGGAYAVSPHRGPDAQLESGEVSEMVAQAVDELPEIMKTTLVLRYFEGLSFENIGRMVNRKETAVRKRYSRALDELRRRLEKAMDRN
ncbi:MAG: RNA polymerase sigma factor [bacterium]|nr:RNA polymerase sigma factor [bacterium]